MKDIHTNIYKSPQNLSKVVIYAIGAPTNPDYGNLPDAEIIIMNGYDVVVPDYLGFGRSNGVFSPENCINTLLETYEYYKAKYSEVIFVGRSLGGAYVPLLPKYNPEIDKLILVYPAVDQAAQGEMAGEESNEWFVEQVTGGNSNYRGGDKAVWEVHTANQDGLSPMDNIDCLKKAKIFIGHGKQDKCIYYSKSERYYQKIRKMWPEKKSEAKLRLVEEGDHGPSTSRVVIREALEWFKSWT